MTYPNQLNLNMAGLIDIDLFNPYAPSTMEIEIRNAVERDLKNLLNIYNESVVNSTAVYDDQPRTLQAQSAWFEKKQEMLHPVLVAVEDGQAVGFCSYGPFRAWAGFDRTVESSVYLDASYRGKGIGTRLMSQLIERAIVQEYHVMVAGIDTTNFGSIQLHQKLGFSQVAHFREVGRKFDRWLDLLFLQKILS